MQLYRATVTQTVGPNKLNPETKSTAPPNIRNKYSRTLP